jgi:hypothetical protein
LSSEAQISNQSFDPKTQSLFRPGPVSGAKRLRSMIASRPQIISPRHQLMIDGDSIDDLRGMHDSVFSFYPLFTSAQCGINLAVKDEVAGPVRDLTVTVRKEIWLSLIDTAMSEKGTIIHGSM